ncbi:MAG: SIS domain-containing protein [Pseudomonadales bacterium]
MNIKAKIENVLLKEAQAIQAINVTDEFELAVLMLQNCQGKVVTTGIGKAGFIARKFSATLSSTGTPAVFIHPAEAGHGDLGILNPDDCIVAFSTSGKSNEVIEMLGIARHLGISKVIGITSHPDSLLREHSELILDMGPDIEEPCPLKLTPSATTAVMLAISDSLALTLMELKGFTKEDYGMRHHKGYLGSLSRQKPDYES